MRLMEGPEKGMSQAGSVADGDGASRRQVPWGLGHVGIGLLVGMMASVLAMGIVVVVQGSDAADDPGLVVGSLVQGALYLGLVGVPAWLVFTRGVRWADLGWRRTNTGRVREALQGLAIGVVAQVAAVPILYAPILLLSDDLDVSGPARELVDRANGLGIALLVLMVVAMAPVAEELFFRGLALRAFESRMGRRGALMASGLLFGVTHLQLLQLPARVRSGLGCGWLAQRDGTLGRAVWAHGGFTAVTVLVLL